MPLQVLPAIHLEYFGSGGMAGLNAVQDFAERTVIGLGTPEDDHGPHRSRHSSAKVTGQRVVGERAGRSPRRCPDWRARAKPGVTPIRWLPVDERVLRWCTDRPAVGPPPPALLRRIALDEGLGHRAPSAIGMESWPKPLGMSSSASRLIDADYDPDCITHWPGRSEERR